MLSERLKVSGTLNPLCGTPSDSPFLSFFFSIMPFESHSPKRCHPIPAFVQNTFDFSMASRSPLNSVSAFSPQGDLFTWPLEFAPRGHL